MKKTTQIQTNIIKAVDTHMHTQVEIGSHAAISSDGKSGSRKEMAQRGRNERRR